MKVATRRVGQPERPPQAAGLPHNTSCTGLSSVRAPLILEQLSKFPQSKRFVRAADERTFRPLGAKLFPGCLRAPRFEVHPH